MTSSPNAKIWSLINTVIEVKIKNLYIFIRMFKNIGKSFKFIKLLSLKLLSHCKWVSVINSDSRQELSKLFDYF